MTGTGAIGRRNATTPLDGRHDKRAFRCGVEALDRYLHERAAQDARRNVATLFVAEDRATGAIHGFYSLSMASVNLDRLPADLSRKLPHYPTVPAVRLGRLAVHVDVQGQGIGTHLMTDAMARSLRSEIAWAAFLVDAKDRTAARFYLQFGFQSFQDDPLHLFVARKTIEPLFGT